MVLVGLDWYIGYIFLLDVEIVLLGGCLREALRMLDNLEVS